MEEGATLSPVMGSPAHGELLAPEASESLAYAVGVLSCCLLYVLLPHKHTHLLFSIQWLESESKTDIFLR